MPVLGHEAKACDKLVLGERGGVMGGLTGRVIE